MDGKLAQDLNLEWSVCLRSTCGLAEELDQESKGKNSKLPKSACGSVSICVTQIFVFK